MANPLSNLLTPPAQTPVPASNQIVPLQSFQSVVSILKNAKDPNAALNQFASQNPKFRQVIEMCQGKNPRDVFIEACRARGIDPNQAIQQMGLR